MRSVREWNWKTISGVATIVAVVLASLVSLHKVADLLPKDHWLKEPLAYLILSLYFLTLVSAVAGAYFFWSKHKNGKPNGAGETETQRRMTLALKTLSSARPELDSLLDDQSLSFERRLTDMIITLLAFIQRAVDLLYPEMAICSCKFVETVDDGSRIFRCSYAAATPVRWQSFRDNFQKIEYDRSFSSIAMSDANMVVIPHLWEHPKIALILREPIRNELRSAGLQGLICAPIVLRSGYSGQAEPKIVLKFDFFAENVDDPNTTMLFDDETRTVIHQARDLTGEYLSLLLVRGPQPTDIETPSTDAD